MSVCGVHRATVVCVLTVGFVSILYGLDRMTTVDCCSKLDLSSLKEVREELALLREEMSQLSQMHGMSPYPISCKEIPEQIAIRRQRMDELEKKINILHGELHQDIFFVWQRALEYSAGANCTVHIDYPEDHQCRPFRVQHLSELGELEKKTQKLKDLERHHIAQQLAQNHLKRTSEFKKCQADKSKMRWSEINSGQVRR